jgi:hypothetical protein
LEQIEKEARERGAAKAVETLEAMNERHLKAARVIQAKAVEALRSLPLDSAMDAVRALDLGMKQERLILGEPTDRSEVSVQELVERESRRWLVKGDDENDEQAAAG